MIILFICIVFLCVLTQKTLKCSVVSPGFISCVCFLLFTVIGLAVKGNYDLNEYTIFLIVTTLTIFYAGVYIGERIKVNRVDGVHSVKYVVPKMIVAIYMLLAIYYIYILWSTTVGIAYSVGNIYDFSTQFFMNVRIASLRAAQMSEIYPFSLVMFMEINRGIAYISIFFYLHNKYVCNEKNIYFMYPIFVYVICIILRASRGQLITLFVYFLVLYTYFEINKCGFVNAKKRIIKSVLIYSSLFLFMFFMMRYFRGGDFVVIENLFTYMGAPILALDALVDGDIYVNNGRGDYFGGHTLIGIYWLLNRLGVDVPRIEGGGLEFIYFKSGGDTNVYTFLGQLISDYDFIYILIGVFILGGWYGLLSSYVYFSKYPNFVLCIYAYSIYPVFYMPIAEMFLTSYVSVFTVLDFIVMGFLYSFFKEMRGTIDINKKY